MICITGTSSELKCTLFPPLDLSKSKEWEMGFIDLMTYHSIPNIEENLNNRLKIGNNVISLPTGSYEINDINNYVQKEIKTNNPNIKFQLTANNNTLKSEIFSNEKIDFTIPHSLASLLGFNAEQLEANILHTSSKQVSINKVDIIRITCNIVRGSYRNGIEGHVLHEFYPDCSPGYKIIEKQNIVKYLPINKHSSLEEFYIRFEDQNGDLVNFRGENINIRVDIRKKQNL